MRALLAALFLVFSADGAHAQDGEFSGSIPANRRDAGMVSTSPLAVIRPGHTLTIKLTGQVDINPERKSKRKCSWGGLRCERVSYTDHNFYEPSKLPVTFELRPKGGGTVVRKTIRGQDVLLAPMNVDYRTKYELVAMLSPTGLTIDPDRSVGSFQVAVSINSAARANGLVGWLSSNPSINDSVLDDVLDLATKTRNRVIAAALRSHARNRYPLTNPDNHAAHGKLVARSYALDDGDPDASAAMADYYFAVGLDNEGRAALRRAEEAWRNLPQPRTPEQERQLGETYLKLALNIADVAGGADEQAAMQAASYLDKALERFRAARRNDLVALALTERARLLRRIRSRPALAEATRALEEALKLVPERLAGTGAADSLVPARTVILDSRPALSFTAVNADAPASSDEVIADAFPLFFDSQAGLLVTWQARTVQWRSASAPDTVVSSLALNSEDPVAAAAGRVLVAGPPSGMFSERTFRIVTAAGGAFEVAKVRGCGEPVGHLSVDGEIAVISCRGSVAYRLTNAGATVLKAYDSQPIVAGNAQCGVLREIGQNNDSLVLDRLNGSIITLSAVGAPVSFEGDLIPGIAAFTPEGRMLLLRSADRIEVYSCATGRREDPVLPLPALDKPLPLDEGDQYEIDTAPSLIWLSRDLLAVERRRPVTFGGWKSGYLRTAQIVTIGWPTRTIRTFPLSEADGGELGEPAAGLLSPEGGDQPPRRLLLSPLVAGGAPRRLQPVSVATVIQWDTGYSSPIESVRQDLPGWVSRQTLLVGGRYLLNTTTTGTPFVLDLSAQGKSVFSDLRLAGPLSTEHGWYAFEGSVEALRGVRVMRGGQTTATLPLPGPTASFVDRVLERLNDYLDNEAPDSFPESDIALLRTDRSRLDLSFVAAREVPSLSASTGRSARLLCGVPFARDAAGVRRAVLFTRGTEELWLASAEGDSVALSAVPDNENAECLYSRLVPGARPALLNASARSGTLQLYWWDGAAWRRISTTFANGELDGWQMPFGAWTTEDGRLFLLTAEGDRAFETRQQTNPAATRRWVLRIAATPGAATAACTDCEALELSAALETWNAPICGDENLYDVGAIVRCLGSEAQFIKLDTAGSRLVYPLGDELVVVDLPSGEEVARAPFGMPVSLDAVQLLVRVPPKPGEQGSRLVAYRLGAGP